MVFVFKVDIAVVIKPGIGQSLAVKDLQLAEFSFGMRGVSENNKRTADLRYQLKLLFFVYVYLFEQCIAERIISYKPGKECGIVEQGAFFLRCRCP